MGIDQNTTKNKLKALPEEGIPLHYVMHVRDEPVASGGIYHDVNLLRVDERFKKYDPWLALIYTPPNHRGKGYGYILCQALQQEAKQLGLSKLYLYTVTAESLYIRLGWKTFERIVYKGKDCSVMEIIL